MGETTWGIVLVSRRSRECGRKTGGPCVQSANMFSGGPWSPFHAVSGLSRFGSPPGLRQGKDEQDGCRDENG